jgi:hypothetical protein
VSERGIEVYRAKIEVLNNFHLWPMLRASVVS